MGVNRLVFDFGTSYFKAGLVDAEGALVGLHRTPSPIEHPAAGRSEIAPRRFIQSIRDACAALKARCPQGMRDVAAITWATQANTFLLLDDAGEALTPFVVWNDHRADDVESEVAAWARDPAYRETTGLPSLNHQFTIARLHWMRSHQPRLLDQARRLCLLADYFAWWLTGTHRCEGSVAALGGLFDPRRWEWSPALLERAGVRPELLSNVVRAGTVIGEVRKTIARELGLAGACPLIAGCLDQYAGARGVGNTRPGSISETTGTVLATVACRDAWESPRAHAVFRGPGPAKGLFYHMTFGDVSANLLEHYRSLLPDRPSFEALSAAADAVGDSDDIPHLDETRPMADLLRRIDELADRPDRGAVARGIFEVVARALRSQVILLSGGELPEAIRSAGGAARSGPWLRVKSRVLGIPVHPADTHEPTLAGAASLIDGKTLHSPGM